MTDTPRILTEREIGLRRMAAEFVDPPVAVLELCDSHELLRSERDALRLRVGALEAQLDVRKRCIEGGYQ